MDLHGAVVVSHRLQILSCRPGSAAAGKIIVLAPFSTSAILSYSTRVQFAIAVTVDHFA